jgi:NADH-quinone oxidoreductase subunit C
MADEAKPGGQPPKAAPPAFMQTSPWQGELPDLLTNRFGDRIREFASYVDQNFLITSVEAVPDVIAFLKENGFDYVVDITAVDFPKKESRFELIWILYSFSRNERVRIKATVRENEKAFSVTSLYPAANWLEREVFDMFGIEFAGHPDLRRILLPDDWEGYPLRKDKSILAMDQNWVKNNLGIESGQ